MNQKCQNSKYLLLCLLHCVFGSIRLLALINFFPNILPTINQFSNYEKTLRLTLEYSINRSVLIVTRTKLRSF